MNLDELHKLEARLNRASLLYWFRVLNDPELGWCSL